MKAFCKGLLCCFGCAANRKELREKLDLEGNYFKDCCIHFWCSCLAAKQEWNEVMRWKGLDNEPGNLLWNVMNYLEDNEEVNKQEKERKRIERTYSVNCGGIEISPD